MRQQKMCIPDGLIINEKKKFLIIPECKSAIPEEADTEPRINHQIASYSSKRFHKILHKLVDYVDYEIVVFTFSDVVNSLIKQLQSINSDANIVMWSLEEQPYKHEVLIRKVYGNHSDQDLDQMMSLSGAVCEPPAREFIDPDMPEPRIIFVLGSRLLCTIGECLLNKKMVVVPSEFRRGNLDLVFPERKLRSYFRVLSKLIPELCSFDRKSGNILLKRHMKPEKVHQRLQEIAQMTNQEYRKALGYPAEEETYRKIEKEIEETFRPKRTPTLDEIWGEK